MGIEKKGGYEIQRQREMVTVQKSRGVARRVRGRSGHVKATARRVMLASSTQEAAGSTRRALLSGVGVAASLLILPFFSGEARAGLLDDLLERSAANKEANDKHGQRTFDANLARTRTVTDQICAFPKNFFGCENYAEVAEVKFISDDIKGECANTPDGKVCRSKVKNSFPSFLGLQLVMNIQIRVEREKDDTFSLSHSYL